MRNRTSSPPVLVAATLVAGILIFVGLAVSQATSTSARQPSPPTGGADIREQAAPTPVWECFRVEGGNRVQTDLDLWTRNFDMDDVHVDISNRVCERANKYRNPPAGTQLLPPDTTELVQCWTIYGGADPNATVLLTTANWGSHKLRVRTAVQVCEGAVKQRLDRPGEPPEGTLTPRVWQCFRLEPVRYVFRGATFVTRNFGAHKAIVVRPVLMCEEAVKFREGRPPFGEDTGGVLECFSLVHQIKQDVPARLTTENFGEDELRIRAPDLVCERAEKIHFDQ
jgi:hypothetical protein